MSFNAYHHFLQPRDFLKKARELLLPRGRLTVAFPFGRERINTLSSVMPGGLARQLLPAEGEAKLWREFFAIDCICDNDSLFLLSGTTKKAHHFTNFIPRGGFRTAENSVML